MEFNVVNPSNARQSAWFGGSLLSNLSTVRDICIQASEYEEYGPVMMRRKCWGLGLQEGFSSGSSISPLGRFSGSGSSVRI